MGCGACSQRNALRSGCRSKKTARTLRRLQLLLEEKEDSIESGVEGFMVQYGWNGDLEVKWFFLRVQSNCVRC